MQVVSSFLTFPGIDWWMYAAKADVVILDPLEHFQKMSYRNRYRISGSNGSILLTVPLVSGREQKRAMKDVEIFNSQDWQTQHWRTLVSVYKRAPYFEHYEPELKQFFTREFQFLCGFSRAGIEWLRKQLKLQFELAEAKEFQKKYADDVVDLRNVKETVSQTPKYYQVFEDRIGFAPGLSVLDLLFSEGPAAKDVLLRPI